MLADLAWPILSILAAIFSCGCLLTSQFFKEGGQYLVLMSRIFTLFAFIPILFFIPWPTDYRFYGAVIITGILVGYADTNMMNLTAKYGGGVVSRVLPLVILMTFVFWLMIKPSQIFDYLERPLQSLLTLLTLSGCVFFSSNMRHCAVSFDALKKMIPTLICFALNMALAKYAFGYSSFHSGVYYYILVQTATVIPIMILLGTTSKKPFLKIDIKKLSQRNILASGLLVSIFWILSMISKNYANTLTPNPSYVAALTMTVPVWMIVIYRIIDHKDQTDAKSGIGLMICTIFLTLLTIKT